MGVIKNFGSGVNPVDVITAFKTEAQKPYTSLFVKFGDGRHAFGYAEFKTMEEFATEINYTARESKVRKSSFTASLTDDTAIIGFDNPDIRNNFMTAMLGRNVELNDLVIQVSNKSREWHQAAEEHLDYTARKRHEEKLPASPIYPKANAGFGHLLVDYVFSDIDALRSFYEKLRSMEIDQRSAAIEKERQRDVRPA